MKKVIFLLNIGEYCPELTRLTYPRIEHWAQKIGADIHHITTRQFPDWDLDYEKLQIFQLGKDLKADWHIYIDSDVLVHPELPDFTELLPRDTIAHNGTDFAPIRWKYDDYFRRDGRHIGSCNWLAVASSWCRDLWRPLDDLTPAEAVGNISLTVSEARGDVREHGLTPSYWPPVVSREHLVSDYALSRNIARFGLKATTLGALWQQHGLQNPNFFHHVYTVPLDEKIRLMKQVITTWRV